LIELEAIAEQRINQNQAISIASRMHGTINHNTNLSNSTSLLEENSQNSYLGNLDQATFAGMPVVIDEKKENEVSLYLLLNSVLWFCKSGKARLYADLIVHPWGFSQLFPENFTRRGNAEQDFRDGFDREIQCDRGTLYNRR
jgi:hypothetical protein